MFATEDENYTITFRFIGSANIIQFLDQFLNHFLVRRAGKMNLKPGIFLPTWTTTDGRHIYRGTIFLEQRKEVSQHFEER
jgi:hypothetical protein